MSIRESVEDIQVLHDIDDDIDNCFSLFVTVVNKRIMSASDKQAMIAEYETIIDKLKIVHWNLIGQVLDYIIKERNE